jgi:hypothetical protein
MVEENVVCNSKWGQWDEPAVLYSNPAELHIKIKAGDHNWWLIWSERSRRKDVRRLAALSSNVVIPDRKVLFLIQKPTPCSQPIAKSRMEGGVLSSRIGFGNHIHPLVSCHLRLYTPSFSGFWEPGDSSCSKIEPKLDSAVALFG